MINSTVLMSDAQHFSAEQAINPYYGDPSVDIERATKEHATIQQLLEQAGITVIKTTSPTDSQDGVYTANWALVRGDTAILARLPDVRKSEEDHAEKVLTELGKTVVRVPEGLRFSGQGDALACGDYLFCGNGYRSDLAAQSFAADRLGYKRIQLQTIPELDEAGNPKINSISGWPDSFFYDIDLALAVIKAPNEQEKGLIAYCHEAFTAESQQVLASLEQFDTIHVSLDEAQNTFATNLVSTGETVVMTGNAPKLQSALERHGLTILTANIHELAKGGGYIRCTTLTLS